MLQLTVENSVKLPDIFSIAFRDPHREVLEAAKVKIGSKVEIRVFSETAPQGEKLVSGEVTALEAELDAEATITVVRGLDLSHRLFRGRVTETYANVTYSDVATKVARRAGLETGTVDATKTVHDHVSQGNVTDWDFLNGLAREVGFHVGVIDGKFEFRKPKDSSAGARRRGSYTSQDPLQLVMGKDLLRFRAVVRVERAGRGGAGQGLGHAPEEGGRGHRAGQDDQRGHRHDADRPGRQVRQPALRRRRRARTTSRARSTPPPPPWPRTSPAPSPSSRAWPGATPRSAPAGR